MHIKRMLCYCVTVAALAVPIPTSAQATGGGFTDLVPNLILTGIFLPGADDPGRPHAGHFTLGNPTLGGSQAASRPDTASIGAVVAFGDRLRAQVANVPLGSSTGGFTYSFDEASGTYNRNTTSFGPAYTERATTIGRRKLSVGVNYQHTSFDTFGGEDLRDGSIVFFLPHTDCCNMAMPPPSPQFPGFEGDIMEAAMELNATTDTVALFANYGVTDRLDLGVAIPITRVDLEANVRARILRLSSADNVRIHTFVEGRDVTEATFSSAGSATGLGDVVLRTKYNFWQRGNTGVSAALDLRLPTGDENDLLGLGTTQAKVFVILSSGRDRIFPHVNIGYTASGEGDRNPLFGFTPIGVSDEFSYAGGVELVAHPRLTLLADFLGRTLIDAGTLELESRSFPFRAGSGAAATAPIVMSTTNPRTGQPYQQLALQSGNLSVMLGAAGLKYNVAGNLLVMTNFVFPLNNKGLRDRLTFAVGVDYAF